MPAKHSTVGTTATTVILTVPTSAPNMRHLVVVNRDNGATGELFFTYATEDQTPTTAVADADDTFPVTAGTGPMPMLLGNVSKVTVSIIADTASTPYSILAG